MHSVHQWEVYLLCINHSLRSFNPSLGWYLIIPVAVLCFREMTFMSDLSLMLHFLLLSSAWTNERTASIRLDQWEDSIHQITQAPVLMMSPVPVTVPRLYPDLDSNTLASKLWFKSQMVVDFQINRVPCLPKLLKEMAWLSKTMPIPTN